MNTPTLPPRLRNPYSVKSDGELKRINGDISLEDWTLLRAVCPLDGTFNTIVGTFCKHTCNELRKQNIDTYNPNALIAILHDCTNHSPSAETSASDDAERAESIRPATPSDANKSAKSTSAIASGVSGPVARTVVKKAH